MTRGGNKILIVVFFGESRPSYDGRLLLFSAHLQAF